jgi:hypothetical protein
MYSKKSNYCAYEMFLFAIKALTKPKVKTNEVL